MELVDTRSLVLAADGLTWLEALDLQEFEGQQVQRDLRTPREASLHLDDVAQEFFRVLVLKLPKVSKVIFLHPNRFNFTLASRPRICVRSLAVVAAIKPQDISLLKLVEGNRHPSPEHVLLCFYHATEDDAHLLIWKYYRVCVMVLDDHFR